MKKNVPITQRAEVKTNSKNKVEEPLLNVGPAGVYGNNQTRKIPSPAKQTVPLEPGVGSQRSLENPRGDPAQRARVPSRVYVQ